MKSKCEGEKRNSKEQIFGHFSQNSSKLKAYIPKVADREFFLCHTDKMFFVSSHTSLSNFILQ